MSSYSQNSLKNTSILQQTKTIVPDSVKVPFEYLKAANKAFLEAKYSRTLIRLYKTEISTKDTEIIYYQAAQTKCQQAYDTLTQKTIPFLQKESDDNAQLYQTFKNAYKVQKRKTIGTSIGFGVAVILSFILGFELHR